MVSFLDVAMRRGKLMADMIATQPTREERVAWAVELYRLARESGRGDAMRAVDMMSKVLLARGVLTNAEFDRVRGDA